MDQNQNNALFDLSVSSDAKSQLMDTAKWAKFLAICGMIFLILMVAGGSYIALVVTKSNPEFKEMYRETGVSAQGLGAGIVIVYVLIGLLYFFPCLFTLQFANKMKLALLSNDDLLLAESFRNLKKTFRYLGILTIIGMAFFLLGLVSGGLTTTTSMGG